MVKDYLQVFAQQQIQPIPQEAGAWNLFSRDEIWGQDSIPWSDRISDSSWTLPIEIMLLLSQNRGWFFCTKISWQVGYFCDPTNRHISAECKWKKKKKNIKQAEHLQI